MFRGSPVARTDAARSMGAETEHTPREQIAAPLAQFARQLQNNVAAQRIADGEERQSARALPFARDVQQIAGLPGMIVGLGMPGSPAASPHVVAVHDIARFKRGGGHAARIARLARSFQAVDQNQLAHRIRGSLRAD